MDALIGCAIVALLGLGAVGAGLAMLGILDLRAKLPALEVLPIAMTIGTGLLGWVTFFPGVAGLLNRPALFAIVALGMAGWIPAIGGKASPPQVTPAAGATDRRLLTALLAILAFSLAADLLAAFAPPADADSLAYHFALPKQFLAAGRVEFVPRAVDGAPPLLLHMTYMLALGLGGEKAMTLWVCVLGWLPAWLLYAVARRFVSPAWALTLAILFLDTPAVVYSGNAGHMEVKLGAFALVAAIAAADGIRSGNARYAVLAGLSAGFFLAAKYNGLIFVGAVGLALLLQRTWFRSTLAYGCTVLVAGWQWYLWDYVNAGDPLFPLLYDWLGAKNHLWSPEINVLFRREYFAEEVPAPHNILWLIAYPFIATFQGLPYWESARTGLGPFAILALPFAIWSWLRRRPTDPALVTIGLIAAGFYVVWYLSGSSQRIRHLVPIYPLVLLCLGVAAARFGQTFAYAAPLLAATAMTLLIQLGGHGVFALNYLRYWTNNESRAHFLERNVARYSPVPWINDHLGTGDLLLLTERQLVYHIDIPTYTALPRTQYLVDLLPGDSNPERFLDELKRLGITHILLMPSVAEARQGVRHIWTDELASYTTALVDAGCARVVYTTTVLALESRTVPGISSNAASADVVELRGETCRFEKGGATPIVLDQR